MTRGFGPTTVMRRLDWAAPPPPVHREVLSALPGEPTGRPPLLFVHGAAHGAWCFAEHWLPAAAERGFPAYAVSLRGHGGSGGARRLGRTTMREYVHDVLQTIAELPSRPVLVGHSMGGLIVQLVLERYQAKGGVLLAPAPLHGGARAFLSMARDRPSHALRTAVGGTLPMTPEVLFEGLNPVEAERLSGRTGRESPIAQWQLFVPRTTGPIRTPMLVVGTPDDRLVPLADVERAARRYGVEPLLFPGIGHDLMLDAGQDRVLAAVLDWVGALG